MLIALPKKYRAQRAVAIGLKIQRRAQASRHGNFFAEFFHRMSGKQLVQPRIFNALAGCVVVDVVAQFSAGMALLHQHQLVVDYVVAAEEVAPHTDRPARRRDVQRQCFLNLLQKFEWFLRLAVHFVDKCDYRHVAQTADLEQLARLGFDPARRVDNHDSGVDRRQCPVSIFREILMARRVEQVKCAAAVVVRHHRRCNRNAALSFYLHPVRVGAPGFAARFYRTRSLDRATEQKQLFGQRGFSRIRVRNDGESPPGGYFAAVNAHESVQKFRLAYEMLWPRNIRPFPYNSSTGCLSPYRCGRG